MCAAAKIWKSLLFQYIPRREGSHETSKRVSPESGSKDRLRTRREGHICGSPPACYENVSSSPVPKERGTSASASICGRGLRSDKIVFPAAVEAVESAAHRCVKESGGRVLTASTRPNTTADAVRCGKRRSHLGQAERRELLPHLLPNTGTPGASSTIVVENARGPKERVLARPSR